MDAKAINNLSAISNRNKTLQSSVMHSGLGSSVYTGLPALTKSYLPYYLYLCPLQVAPHLGTNGGIGSH